MKTKKFEKKLTLKKKTIANLSSDQLKDVIGGNALSVPVCPASYMTDCTGCTQCCDSNWVNCTYFKICKTDTCITVCTVGGTD